MPSEPPENEHAETAGPSTSAPSTPLAKSHPPLERSRFGGTERRQERVDEDDAPFSRSDLSKGAKDLHEQGVARINWSVLLVSSVVIIAFSVWAILLPDGARTTMKTTVDWIATNLGWYYVLTMALVIGFVVWVALSKEGDVRLGPDHSRPQYGLATWVAMLFAAGVGIDLLFFSVTGPVVQYLHPPSGDGGTSAAMQDAVVWTMFHYGIAGWSVYALLGMAMGYFAYRWDMPLSIRAALYPLFGKRVLGPVGDGISTIALVGTVFGVATSMGIGVVLLNLWSAVAMMAYILIAGQTAFLLNALVENIGQFLVTLPARMLQTFAYEPGSSDWMGSWTLFFWAFWLAWGPFVGVFLARISRGRTLREFVIAAITVPVLCDFIIVSFFGNSALYQVLQGNTAFAELAVQSPEQGWYALLEMFPGAVFLVALATFSGFLFYITSANSGAMVMSNFSASIPDPSQDGPKWLRIFWAVLTAVLTIAMLLAGGVVTMEYATLIFALPVTVIAYLVMASFYKALRIERAEREGQVLRRPSVAPSGGHVPERSWKQRLGQLLAFPSRREVSRFLERTVRPALDELTAEFRNQGYEVERGNVTYATGMEGPLLRVAMDAFQDFHYQVAIVEAPVPTFSGKMARETDLYYRLEVFTQTGSGGYDLMGLTRQQVIDDVLERYEAHLASLTSSPEADTASAPAAAPKGR